MQRYRDSITNSQGQPVSGATVLVTPSGTATSTSTLYGDKLGTSTVANPLTTDNNGAFGFYAANGRYDLIVSGAYITTTTASDVMLEDVPLSNLVELSTQSAARANLGMGTSTGAVLAAANNLADVASAATARGNLSALSSTSSQSVGGGQRGAVVALASTGQIAPDFSTANNFSLAMSANTTLATPTNVQPGQSGRVVISQNSTAKTLAYSSFWKFAAAATATLSTATTVGTRDVLRYFTLDSTSAECEMRNGVA